VLLERAGERQTELVVNDGFGEEVHSAGAECFDGGLDRGVSGQQDHGG
jgi:hypothetical protein